jgi:hypothetical protein
MEAGGGGKPLCWNWFMESHRNCASVDNSTVVCQPSHTPQLSAPSVCVCAGLRKQTPRLVHTPPPLSTGTGLGFSITPTHVTVVYLLLVAHNGVILDGRHVDACTSLLCTHPSSPIKPDTSAA